MSTSVNLKDRERTAEREGMDRLLSPRSIAMVGASNQAHRIGGLIFANLKRAFEGALYPVNPSDDEVMGIKAYRSVSDLPETVDLAVVAVPGKLVPGVVEEAAAAGIGGVVVVTSGFAEVGGEGAEWQARLTEISRRTGIRLIGPNCIGYMNLHGGVMANFSLDPTAELPRAGGVALVSQSGGFGSYIAMMALKAGLGLGWFVSTGNEADSSVAMVMRHLVDRPEVKVLLGCVETLRHPEIFIETAERALELDKPIVLLKAGRSEEAARAAMSHTGSIAGSAEVLDAVCRQYGVHIVESMQDMLDLGLMFQTGKRTGGRRVAIVTTSGGAGVLLADEAARAGLSVPELPAEEQSRMLAVMPQPFFGSVSNPVDTTAQVTAMPEALGNLLQQLGSSPSVDMIVTVVWEQAAIHIAGIVEMEAETGKPVSVLCTGAAPKVVEAGIPLYLDPGRAVRTLGALARQSLDKPAPCRPEAPDSARVARMRAMLAQCEGRKVLMEHEGKRLFAEYGIPVTREKLVTAPAEATAAVEAIGGLAALKFMSPQLLHKSDAGGIRLGVTASAARAEAEAMLEEVAAKAPGARLSGILVQEMVPARLELTCGIKHDPVFGPMVVLGLGGLMVEIMAEVAMLRPPFGADAARRAIEGLCGGRVVSARRGLEPAELDAAVAIVSGLGRIALELPEIAEIDINPIRIAHGRAVAADALVVLADPSE
ncbi:MAG: acetate--CoA ligase family protein [Novosphingobium sp.]|nr:acetate--CoA ligase family protein [Novosphingobium sp.]